MKTERIYDKKMMKYIFVVVYLIFSVSGLTFMKLGSVNTTLQALTIPFINLKLNIISLLGYGCYAVSFLIYTIVITKFDLGLIIPLLSGIVNVLIFIVAIIVFKESFTCSSIIGLVLICLGVFFMNLK